MRLKHSVVSFGGGVDSTAMLVGLYLRGITPNAIVFADTGGEMPETYKHLTAVSDWLARVGFPELTIRRYESPRHSSLEDECLNNETLPSKAFGNAGCSVKWKRQVVDKWITDESGFGSEPRDRLIGINADEVRRGQIPDTALDHFDYPLKRWNWGREECRRVCFAVFGYIPHKSACFFCPAMKKHEIISLSQNHPDLFQRAVAMERNAAPNLDTVKGLGRSFSWEALVRANESQRRMMFETVEPHCVGECDT